ncbi:MAG TPA: GntR family transcriptional regulator [Steroidobacteraceae bacterium]|nr:GntR family transcriptional regulator [Steroidobacteraceae bacterium]
MTESPGYRPLYRQVYDIVVRRVAEGKWRPGEALPSEQNLAREMGVSQGTMRKVLDSLTAEKLLERRQGKGTFIAENTQESDRVRDQHRGRTRRAQTRACDRGG